MSCWSVLGVAPGSDARTIKSAYAKLLKKVKPDEDPEGFKLLHNAYKQATKNAKQQARQALYSEEPVAVEELVQPHVTPEEPRHIDAGAADTARDLTASPVPYPSTESEHLNKLVVTEEEGIAAAEETLTSSEGAPIHDDPPEHLKNDAGIGVDQSTVINGQSVPEPIPNLQNQLAPHESDQKQNVETQTELTEHFAEEQPPEEILIAETERLVADAVRRNDLAEWERLLASPLLFDVFFKPWFSQRLFMLVLEQLRMGGRNKSFTRETLLFLNQRFLWLVHTDLLDRHFSPEDIQRFRQQTLSKGERIKERCLCPKKHTGPVVYCGYFRKVLACALDLVFCIVLFACLSLLDGLLGYPVAGEANKTSLVLLFATIVFVFAVMEATPCQGSPGKMLFGFKVVTTKGSRLNILHALYRLLVFSMSSAGIKVTVWINFFLNDGRLLHDRLSFSQVIER